MGLFRSETIIHKKLRLPGEIESAVRILDLLGNLPEESIQFIDLTHNDIEAKKNFAPLIKRCDDLDAIVSSFETLCTQFNIKFYSYTNYDNFKADIARDQIMRNAQNGAYFDVLESELLEQERKINELLESYNKMKEDLIMETEKKIVYEKYSTLIRRSGIDNNNNYGSKNNSLAFIIGVAKAEEDIKMKRMIFRASRGTAIASFFDIEEDKNKEHKSKIEKKIFIIFYPSEGKEILRGKLLKICDIFNASRYQPENDDAVSTIEELRKSIDEKKNILKASRKEIKNYLYDISGTSFIPGKISLFKLYFKKMKMIYENLAKCIHRKNFIDGEVWIIEKNYTMLQRNLEILQNDSNDSSGAFINIIGSEIKKPTYIPVNEFTSPFQDVVNTYGIPRYQEVNPAYFNIVFFPFLFGMMFGDIGHGFILALVGLYLLINSQKIKHNKNSVFNYLVEYRYFIFLMGFCAFFCGFLYNDFLGVPLPIFKSCYREMNKDIAIKKKGCTYPFGIDSKWYSATNELSFVNSIKMKLSVIFGVFQMVFGIILKGMNDFYFKDYLSFIFEFIPQLIFMCLLFGYMIVLIFVKWSINWSNYLNPPSIITQMINIFLKYGSVSDNPLWGGKSTTHGKYTQERVHIIFFIISVCMIPLMFLVKPFVLYFLKRKNRQSNRIDVHNALLPNEDNNLIDNEEEEKLTHNNIELDGHNSYLESPKKDYEEGLMDLLVNQLIETIEFVLGAVSNTASYLRLWALSLAHSQLSKVFLEKTVLNSFTSGDFYYGLNVIRLIIFFFIFAHVTLFVLMFMDLLECFLHTLRLHWVEFQNKFFKADGYAFVPFSFKTLINIDDNNKKK